MAAIKLGTLFLTEVSAVAGARICATGTELHPAAHAEATPVPGPERTGLEATSGTSEEQKSKAHLVHGTRLLREFRKFKKNSLLDYIRLCEQHMTRKPDFRSLAHLKSNTKKEFWKFTLMTWSNFGGQFWKILKHYGVTNSRVVPIEDQLRTFSPGLQYR